MIPSVIMETVKVPKFKWSEILELNSGHTPNEWGMPQKNQNKIQILNTEEIMQKMI